MIRRSRFTLAVLVVSSLLAVAAHPVAAQDVEQVKPTKITADAAYISSSTSRTATTARETLRSPSWRPSRANSR